MDLLESAERQILDRYAPAFVVINSDGEVLQSSGRTGKYLELPAGAPDTNVFGLARRGLRMEMRAVVSKAIKSGQVAVQSDLRIGTDGGQQTLNLIVQPLRTEDAANASYMIIFQDVGEIESQTKSNQILIDVDGASRQLEAELRAIKERLQTTTEELESSNEELKSANEELSSINEELQSSNEELETSKEELQSTNEELHTVNSELSLRVEELGKANSDVRNLLENTQIATIFLDRDLAIKSFTPAAKDVFRLVDSDAGRPITHVRTRFTLDALQEDMEKVLRTLGTIERYVQSTDSNAFYVVRILPYRTVDEVIGGVVLTFTDVTQITIAETKIEDLTRDLRNRFDSLETVVDLVPVGIVILNDSASEPIRVNRAGARLLGDDDSGKGLRPVSVPIRLFDKGRELLPNETPLRQAHESRKTIANFEGRLLRADGSYVSVALSASPLFNKAGEIRGAIAAIADISQRKLAELHQQLLVNELNHRVKNMLATVQAVASQSFRNAGSMAQARGAFEQRLMALSIAHDMLTRENWEAVGLTEIVSGFMAAHCAVDHGQYTADGPEVRISPKSALALSMALHELGTNALKYGALSTKAGHVSILWTVTKPVPDQRLLMSWVETGGPSVAPPKKRGFGTRMIERGLAQDLGGQVILDFAETGIVCTIDAPLELVTMREQLQ
jgi:two-component system CheB/CheR fusion protein